MNGLNEKTNINRGTQPYYRNNMSGSVPNLQEYEMVLSSSEEYRNYLWNEFARKNPTNTIMSEQDFYNNNSRPQQFDQRPDSRPEPANRRMSDLRNVTYGNGVSAATTAVVKKPKSQSAIFLAYFFIISIIILLVVVSAKTAGSSNASQGDLDDDKTVQQDDTGNVWSNNFYSDKTELVFDNSSESNLLIINSTENKQESNNWFDSICDKIDNIVGG